MKTLYDHLDRLTEQFHELERLIRGPDVKVEGLDLSFEGRKLLYRGKRVMECKSADRIAAAGLVPGLLAAIDKEDERMTAEAEKAVRVLDEQIDLLTAGVLVKEST